MMFYMIYSLYTNESIAAMHGGQTIQYTLNFGMVIVGIFAVIFLFYTNSFVIKRRQKEFGLFNVLGMEKRHLGIVLLFEVLFDYFAYFARKLRRRFLYFVEVNAVYDFVICVYLCRYIYLFSYPYQHIKTRRIIKGR